MAELEILIRFKVGVKVNIQAIFDKDISYLPFTPEKLYFFSFSEYFTVLGLWAFSLTVQFSFFQSMLYFELYVKPRLTGLCGFTLNSCAAC
jgi:hypothetical protein